MASTCFLFMEGKKAYEIYIVLSHLSLSNINAIYTIVQQGNGKRIVKVSIIQPNIILLFYLLQRWIVERYAYSYHNFT